MLALVMAYDAVKDGLKDGLVDREEFLGALKDCGITVKELSWLWASGSPQKPMDRALIERQLNGDGHLSHKRFSQLPLKFWSAYGWRLILKYGVPREAKRAVPVMLAFWASKRTVARSRMLRAHMNQKREKRIA